jgi:hypothetical protein
VIVIYLNPDKLYKNKDRHIYCWKFGQFGCIFVTRKKEKNRIASDTCGNAPLSGLAITMCASLIGIVWQRDGQSSIYVCQQK